jgi:hypothetical protein
MELSAMRASPFEGRKMLTLRRLSKLSAALLAVVAVAAVGQTTVPVGVTKPAAYDCNGLEGVALTHCRQLNAAAVSGALVRPEVADSQTHDCAGMSGAALATCRDLNGQSAAPVAGANGAGTAGVDSVPAPTGAPSTSGAATPSSGNQPAPAESLPGSPTQLRIVPGNGQVSPPTDRIVPMTPAAGGASPPEATSGGTAAGGAKAGK